MDKRPFEPTRRQRGGEKGEKKQDRHVRGGENTGEMAYTSREDIYLFVPFFPFAFVFVFVFLSLFFLGGEGAMLMRERGPR